MNKYCVLVLCIFNFMHASAQDIVIQSTTSTRDSGFYEYLLPKYPGYSEINIKVVAVGTGQAILNAQNCDGSLLIVHDKVRELKFMDEGYGIKRHSLMFNDFVIVGPTSDPANIKAANSPQEAFKLIATTNSTFISRSDSSGTHSAEVNIWNKSNFDPLQHSGDWYYETGQGMGPSLNIAIATNAYVFTDRSSWLKYKNKRNHRILYSDKNKLKNEYGAILINYDRCKNLNKLNAIDLYNWFTSDEAKSYINSYTIDGIQVFYTH